MAFRYFIKLSFDGTEYCGWQRQPNGVAVQELLEKGLRLIMGFAGSVTGCGRTDAGVSAAIFYAHFDVEKAMDDPEAIVYKLNRFLPPTIAISGIQSVFPEAHARFSAISREYKYRIITEKDPFLFSTAYLLSDKLDVDAMNKGARILLEHSDFECFSKTRTQVKTFNCALSYAHWELSGHELVFCIRADRFLRNMVRAIVGTLLDIGRHKITVEQLVDILESKDRSRAGYSVPAKGLTLSNILYPDALFSESPVFFNQLSDRFFDRGPSEYQNSEDIQL
jgi:tRNA pseudouridine38-40 synthase